MTLSDESGFVKRAITRIGGFGISVIISGAVNLIAIPFVIVAAGEKAFTAVAVGQNVGAFVGILTLLGWAQSGPSEVAKSKGASRGRAYYESLYVRTCSLALTIPISVIVAYFLHTSSWATTSLMSISMIILNLGASWFYVGEGSPRRLLLLDTIPRAVAVGLATLALALGVSIVAYAILICVGGIAAAAISAWDIRRRYGFGNVGILPRVAFLTILSRQKHGLGTAALSAFYLSLPLLVVQSVSPSGAASYALVDKLRQQALTAFRPLSQVLQGWTPSGGPSKVAERVKRAWLAAITLGLVGALGFSLLGPLISHILSAGRVPLELSITLPIGIAFGMNVISLTTGVACLVALNLERHITISAAIGTAISVALLIPLTHISGGIGTAWAVALSQSCVAAYQSSILFFHFKKRSA